MVNVKYSLQCRYLFVDKMCVVLRVICLLICCNVAINDSQDIVGCGGFIKSEVEINFSVIEVCTHCHLRAVVKCGMRNIDAEWE